MGNLNGDEWSYQWVVEQWKNDTYKIVKDLFDAPYNKSPAPSKIPGAALEFESTKLGAIVASKLSLSNGVAEFKWDSGVELNTLFMRINMWTIILSYKKEKDETSVEFLANRCLWTDYKESLKSHENWLKKFWSKSSIKYS